MMLKMKGISAYELLYDLIFAYAISRISLVLVIESDKMIALMNLVEFLMLTLVFWSIWTYQTVFINRFFENDRSSPLFLLFDLFWVVVLSQIINQDFESVYGTFVGVTSILFLSIAVQYYLKMKTTEEIETRILCSQLSAILGIASIIGFATIFPWGDYSLRFALSAISILVVASVPIIISKSLRKFPTRFDYLVQRISLFTLLLFGEAIITVAGTIIAPKISLENLLFYILVVLLFLFYHTVSKSGIERERATTGLVLIHAHYFIFTGLGLSSVLYANYLQGAIQSQYFVLVVGVALIFFLGGTLANCIAYSTYPHDYRPFIWKSLAAFAVWLTVSFLLWQIVSLFLGVSILLLLFLLYKLQSELTPSKI